VTVRISIIVISLSAIAACNIIPYQKYTGDTGKPLGYTQQVLGQQSFGVAYYFPIDGRVDDAKKHLKRRAYEICLSGFKMSDIELRFPVSTKKLDYQWVYAKVECHSNKSINKDIKS